MNMIVKPITADGMVGYDSFNQLIVQVVRDGFTRTHMIHDVRAKRCYICDRTWENTAASLSDQYIDGDRYMHLTCHRGHMKVVAHERISDALIAAGYLFSMEEVAPRYPHSTPWQRITVLLTDPARSDSHYRIVLGRRKRVWEVRLHAHNGAEAAELFADVSDTKGYHETGSVEEPEFGPYYFVHAYTQEQLVDYLKRFRMLLPSTVYRENAQYGSLA